jgi:ribosome-binding protein aMBF1 (putative translation factor)
MSPPKAIEDEHDGEVSLREIQRFAKLDERRRRGLPEPSELARQVATSLWVHRQLMHLTQQQLAELLGMKQPQIARLEAGLVNPTFETLARISEKLGVEIEIRVRDGILTASATPAGALATPPGNRPA